MSDSDIFSMSSNRKNVNKKNIKKKLSIQAFLSKNAGPGKVVRNLSGSLYMKNEITVSSTMHKFYLSNGTYFFLHDFEII